MSGKIRAVSLFQTQHTNTVGESNFSSRLFCHLDCTIKNPGTKTSSEEVRLQIRAGVFLLRHAEEFHLRLTAPWQIGVESGQRGRDNLRILFLSEFIKEGVINFGKRIRDASLTNADLVFDHVLHQLLTIYQHDF